MEPVLYMSQTVFTAVMLIAITGLGATVALLLTILFRERKNKTLW